MTHFTSVAGWQIGKRLGGGKSAQVYIASKDGNHVALKIFNQDLVERFGKDTQLKRIQREISLVGKQHPNLVRIFDGGECSDTGVLYIAMELIDAPDLATVIADVPREKVATILTQVASAAEYLESLNLVHRDIKPDNIAISRDFEHATLLDLGVIRPIGVADLTDTEQRFFVGTLRYSSPEYLLREEVDDIDGWRALSFYQLGAVLHDMIMRERLFSNITEPYARLVQAVERDIPNILSAEVNPELVLLARNCLQKDPNLRIRLVNWESFKLLSTKSTRVADLKDRLRQRSTHLSDSFHHIETDEYSKMLAISRQCAQIVDVVQSIIRDECAGSEILPSVLIQDIPCNDSALGCCSAYLETTKHYGTNAPIHLWFSVRIIDYNSAVIEIRAGAKVSMTDLPGSVFVGTDSTVFFGSFDKAAVKPVSQQVLYASLLEAQEKTSSDEFDVTEGYWLNLDLMES